MTPCDEFIQPLHLAETQRGVNIRHAVIESEIDLLVVPQLMWWPGTHVLRIARNTVATEQAHAFCQFLVISNRHAAFGRRNDLHRVKTEDSDVAIPAIAHVLALVTSTDRV